MWREYDGHAPAVALIMPVNTGRGLVFRPFQLARVQMPPTPLKARARGLRTLAIAWVRGVLGCNDFSAGATKHAWRPSPSPWPPSSPPRGAEGGWVPRSCPRTPVCSATASGMGNVGCGSERTLATPYAMVAQIRYVPGEQCGFLMRLLYHSVRSQRRSCHNTKR